MRTDCDRGWEIDALREGSLGAKDAEAFERHLRGCETCAGTVTRDARLRALALSLPESEPNELEVRRLRARVLHDVAVGARPRRSIPAPLVALTATLLVGAAAWALAPRRAPLPPVASLPAPASESSSHAPNAEVELGPEQRGSAPVAGSSTAATPRSPRRSVSPSGAATARRTPPASGGDEDDDLGAYASAIALLQAEKYEDAARAFRAFVAAHPHASQTEDASFLEAAALARGGRSDAAALVAEDHLTRFPRSFHHKEAAILVARAARDRGDCAKARAVLAPWLGESIDREAAATLQRCGGDSTGR
jgi:hypothetical protein